MPSIAIRNVPQDVRDVLAERSAREGKSMQEYLLGWLTNLARRPTNAELIHRINARIAATGETLSADEIVQSIREDRDSP